MSRKINTDSYASFIRKVLKAVDPDVGITKETLMIVDKLVKDLEHKLSSKAAELVRYNKKRTMTSKEVQTSVKLCMPKNLADHAVSEASKAVSAYNSSYSK